MHDVPEKQIYIKNNKKEKKELKYRIGSLRYVLLTNAQRKVFQTKKHII